MSDHVYARLSGYGWTLLPRTPFQFSRPSHQPRSVVATHQAANVTRRATLIFDEPTPVVRLADETDRLGDVLELAEGPNRDHWRIETSVYSIRWPGGFALHSAPEPPGFDLIGPNGCLVSLQGPFDPRNLPPLKEMVGAGQHVHGIGSSWIELDYRQDGVPWRQTHRLISFGGDVVVVTSQAPENWNSLVVEVALAVADSLSPMNNDD